MPELTVEEWFGYVGPSKMPAALVTAANQAIAAALKDAGVLTALQTVGLIPLAMTTAEMTASMKVEHDRWGPLIKRIGFTAES
jgi:tripartite-type tricarboxylate transporter receptor subunit TctC